MTELLSDPAVKAGLAVVVLLVVSAIALQMVLRFRDSAREDPDITAEALSNLEEMRLKGELSEEEFRTIQPASSRGDQS